MWKLKTFNLIETTFLLGALLNFLPQLFGYSLLDPETNLYPSYLYDLSDIKYTSSIIASLASSIPIVIELLLDTLNGWFEQKGIASERRKDMSVFIPFREVIFLLIIPDLLFLCWVLPYKKFDFMSGLVGARDILFIYSFLAYLGRMKNPIWTWHSTLLIASPFMVTNILLSFQTQIGPDYSSAVSIMIVVLTSFGFLSLIVTIVRWLHYLRHCGSLDKSEEMQNNLCSVYALFYTIFLFGDWILVFSPVYPESWSPLGVDFLTFYTYLMAGCTLMTTVITNRFSRMDANETKVILNCHYLLNDL